MSDPLAITVSQTLGSVGLSPAGPTLDNGQTQQFSATARDQFGNAMATQPAFAWSVDADADAADGTITPGGLYTAPASGIGNDTVRASGGGLAGTATTNIGAGTVPDPIAGLTATTFSTSRIDLNWDDHLLSNVRYNVYRSTTPDFTDSSMIVTDLVESEFSDATVASSTRYYYIVTAVAMAEESFVSDLASAITAFNTEPSDFFASVVDEFGIELTWQDDSGNETGYVVEKSLDGLTGWTSVATLPKDETFFFADNLETQTNYFFRVHAGHEGTTPIYAQTSARTTAPGDRIGLVVTILGHNQRLSTPRAQAGISDITFRLRERYHISSSRTWIQSN